MGVIPYLEKKYHDAVGDYWQEEIEKYMVNKTFLIFHGKINQKTPLYHFGVILVIQ